MNAQKPVVPCILQPQFVERIWGEQTISPWYQQPAPGKPIGEVWLTSEQCTEETSGATLAELAAESPEAFGNRDGEGFPLLIKLLYPREKLSVQVHPDDAQAKATLNQPRGKTECWYVLSAEPGAQVAVGFCQAVTADEIREAIQDGTIETKLRYLTVKAGDMVFIDAGTVHAIGPGVVVLETQQYSDVTYRLWDYGRPRELHLDAGLQVARSETSAGLVAPEFNDGFTRLVTSQYFRVDSFELENGSSAGLRNRDTLQILVAIGFGASIRTGEREIEIPPGQAVVLPAGMEESTLQGSRPVEVVRILP